MSTDFEDKPRRAKKEGDNTLKIVLIVLASFFGLTMLVCCGGAGAMYYFGKRAVERMAMSSPADIQKLTADITDITIPPEFSPQSGTDFFGVKNVQYVWCPGGNCPKKAGFEALAVTDNVLALNSIKIGDGKTPPGNSSDSSDVLMSDEVLKEQWKEFTKTEHEFVIRGKASKFYIIQGEEFLTPDFDDETESSESAAATPGTTLTKAEEVTEADPATADPAAGEAREDEAMQEPKTQSAPRAGTGKQIVQISGSFPGKEAECTLSLRLDAEHYNEAIILDMLKSIK